MSKLKCKHCNKEFGSKQALGGHIKQAHPGGGGKVKRIEKVGTKKERFQIRSSKSVKLGGRDLHLAEELIKQGYADNLIDLIHKSLNLFGKHVLGEEGETLELYRALAKKAWEERNYYASLVAYKIMQ